MLSKQDFSRRYKAGEFGNASPTWDTLEEFKATTLDLDSLRGRTATDAELKSRWGYGKNQRFHLRNRVIGGPTHYNLTSKELCDLWYQNINSPNWYCSAMAPTARTVIQGEICRSSQCLVYGGYPLYFLGTEVKKPMREALAEHQFEHHGFWAIRYLQSKMRSNSWEWLNHLLDTYPDHVVEFSVYAICWGTVPHYDTVFWEVRKY